MSLIEKEIKRKLQINISYLNEARLSPFLTNKIAVQLLLFVFFFVF